MGQRRADGLAQRPRTPWYLRDLGRSLEPRQARDLALRAVPGCRSGACAAQGGPGRISGPGARLLGLRRIRRRAAPAARRDADAHEGSPGPARPGVRRHRQARLGTRRSGARAARAAVEQSHRRSRQDRRRRRLVDAVAARSGARDPEDDAARVERAGGRAGVVRPQRDGQHPSHGLRVAHGDAARPRLSRPPSSTTCPTTTGSTYRPGAAVDDRRFRPPRAAHVPLAEARVQGRRRRGS